MCNVFDYIKQFSHFLLHQFFLSTHPRGFWKHKKSNLFSISSWVSGFLMKFGPLTRSHTLQENWLCHSHQVSFSKSFTFRSRTSCLPLFPIIRLWLVWVCTVFFFCTVLCTWSQTLWTYLGNYSPMFWKVYFTVDIYHLWIFQSLCYS